MNCVDFDKHFESYVRQWSKENMARYKNVDAMEADIPEVYLRWLNEPCDWLSGRTPGNYFAQFDDAKFLCKWLCDYVKKKVPVPDQLLERITEMGEASVPHLLDIAARKEAAGEVRMTAIGLPAGLATIMYSVANVIIQKAINLLGTDTAAAWSIYWKLDGFYWPISNAIGITVMTFAGQNFGARQLGRIYSVIHTGLWMHAGFSALFSVLMFLTRGLTVRFFTDDGNVMAEGSRIITMLAFFYPTFCCVEVLSSAMRGCGRSVMPTVLTLFGTCLLRLALLFFVTFPHLSNWTIALCYPATWLTTSVLFVIYYKCFRWMPEMKQV